MAIVSMLLPIGLKLFDLWLANKKVDAEFRKAYLEFIDLMGKYGLISAKLNQSYAEQRSRNQKEIELLSKQVVKAEGK